jgi:histidinol-phosphatase
MNFQVEYGGLLEAIAGEADQIAMRYFRNRALRVERKTDGSAVTNADREIEEMARARVAASGLALDVLGEEMGETRGSGNAKLIIDPIDGTEEFSRGIGTFGTLLGIEREGEIVAGWVSAPALGSRWWAYRGAGAFRDGRRMEVSGVKQLRKSMVITCGTDQRHDLEAIARMRRVTDAAQTSRGFGGFWQHLLVAEGAAEAGIDLRMSAWDIAPLMVILEEAGGRGTNLSGKRTIHGGSFLTSNGHIHAEVVEYFQ